MHTGVHSDVAHISGKSLVSMLQLLYNRKQQILRGTKLLRFSRIFNETRKFSLLILGYGTS